MSYTQLNSISETARTPPLCEICSPSVMSDAHIFGFTGGTDLPQPQKLSVAQWKAILRDPTMSKPVGATSTTVQRLTTSQRYTNSEAVIRSNATYGN